MAEFVSTIPQHTTGRIEETSTRLRGRIIIDRSGYQNVMTESREPGKNIIIFCGFRRIKNATTGHKVLLTYCVQYDSDGNAVEGFWKGKRIE